jgi:hypothetical protein
MSAFDPKRTWSHVNVLHQGQIGLALGHAAANVCLTGLSEAFL